VGLGACLPLAAAAVSMGREASGREGRIAAKLSAHQNLGGAIGALATGWLLLDWLPTKVGFLLASLVLLGSACLAALPSRRLPLLVALGLAGLAAAGAAIRIDRPVVLDSHVFRGSRGANMSLVASAEEAGGIASVVVDERRNERLLYTDGFEAAGTG